MNKDNQSTMYVTGAILLAGLIIGGAIIYSGSSGSGNEDGAVAALAEKDSIKEEVDTPKAPGPDNVKEVTADDHILGSLDASVKLIEFSDIECPYCKRFHLSIEAMMDEYKDGTDVAWVYRHFPLDSLHSKARPEAEATECAAELGGNEKFWQFLNTLYATTPSNNQFDLNQLPVIAGKIGLDVDEFNKCVEERRYADKVVDYSDDAINSGARGTPYSILIGPNGEKVVISGAEPIETVKTKINALLGTI